MTNLPNPAAILSEAMGCLQRGDPQTAARTLEAGMQRFPQEPELPLNLSLARRMLGDLAGALQAVDQALALDPYFFMALLSKGALLEAAGHPRLAARAYKDAITIAPPDDRLAPGARQALARARSVVQANAEAMAAHLRTATAAARARHPDADMARMDEALSIVSGLSKPYPQEALFLTVPRLPPIPFLDRSHFPWLAGLENATDMIRDELQAALSQSWALFDPYIDRRPGEPVNQWAKLNHSRDWSTMHLWRDGVRNEPACAQCPKTAALLEELPLARQVGFGPTAMFSVLQPHTHIPPHTGSTNARLICHLPLIVPPKCLYRVGFERREWKLGEAFVFDDTIEHEAFNNSDEVRVVLIFDVWNPLLTPAERDVVTALSLAVRDYNAAG
ncbi:MAG: aspartyl/asparaginyl beta-hydroxylase domain-containing protein [Caulobacterales bacterium]